MALVPKATPEERFKARLAEQEADLVPLPRRLPVWPPLWSSVAFFLVCLLYWIVVLWGIGSGVRKLLRAF